MSSHHKSKSKLKFLLDWESLWSTARISNDQNWNFQEFNPWKEILKEPSSSKSHKSIKRYERKAGGRKSQKESQLKKIPIQRPLPNSSFRYRWQKQSLSTKCKALMKKWRVTQFMFNEKSHFVRGRGLFVMKHTSIVWQPSDQDRGVKVWASLQSFLPVHSEAFSSIQKHPELSPGPAPGGTRHQQASVHHQHSSLAHTHVTSYT